MRPICGGHAVRSGTGSVGRCSVFDRRQQRKIDADAGSLAGSGFDGGGAAERLGPLANPLEAVMAGLDLRRIEADAPIADLDVHAVAGLPQFHADLFALAVAAGVGQAFLHDAEDRAFQRRSETVEFRGMDELDFRAAALALFGDQDSRRRRRRPTRREPAAASR